MTTTNHIDHDVQPSDGDDRGKVIPLRPGANSPMDTHYEVDLDDDTVVDTTTPPVSPVHDRQGRHDTPFGVPDDGPTRQATRRPIVPPGLRRGNVKATAKRAGGSATHHATYHVLRVFWYVLLAAFWAVVGVFRLAGRQLRWWWVLEQHELRQGAASGNDAEAWLKLHADAKATRLWRGSVLAAEVAGVVALVVVLVVAAPWWARVVVGAVAVMWLAHIGRPDGRPIIRGAVVAPRYRKLNGDIVLRAYYSAGLGHLDKPGMQITFGSPMARDGEGSRVLVDLPYGKTFGDAVKAKSSIASGLDVTEQQVFVTRDRTSTRRHVLFVADRDPLAVPAGRSPLLDCRPRDIWQPAPFGLDERARKVAISLLWTSILVGAQARKGKTFSARLLALYAALDPYVRLTVIDGKNSPDWAPLGLVAHRMVYGTVPNSRSADPIEDLLYALREIKKHIEATNDLLSKLSVTECPEGKITRDLTRKYPQLRVWMLVIEEFQVYFETDDQDVNKEVAGLLSYILAVGPSAGVILLSSSQKPSGVGAGDVSRLFNRYRDNHVTRFALKCGNRIVSEAVLGGDAYSEGYDASSLPSGPEYRGVGYLYGADDDTPTVRTYLADAGDAEKILQAARRYREAAGTLSGYATGEEVARQYRDVLADARSVFRPGETWVSWQQLATRLAEAIPEHYADLNPEAISAQVRAFGVPSDNGKVPGGGGQVLRGAKVDEVDAAVARREADRS